MRPWNSIPIIDCGEPLEPLPPTLWRLEPHPYVEAGAPYGPGASPFRLRSGVLTRLLSAQRQLQRLEPSWRLAIFDGWRPLQVQRFMVEQAIDQECRSRGINRAGCGADQLEAVRAAVGRFWAPPNGDPGAPPPHSTGAAVDLTLAEIDGEPLHLGSAIDVIGAVSEPDHFLAIARAAETGSLQEQQALEWHRRRQLLASVMTAAGFVRHPHEWWHFSWGDQLWAWINDQSQAHYGRCQHL